MPMYRSPSGPNASMPPLWFGNGWSIVSSVVTSLSAVSAAPLRATEPRPITVSPFLSV